jgi:ribosomal protein L31E
LSFPILFALPLFDVTISKVQVMEIRNTVPGADHPDALAIMANLHSTFWSQGRQKETEELRLQVLKTSKKVLSEEHPSTLISMANLAVAWKSQAPGPEAVGLLEEFVKLQARV